MLSHIKHLIILPLHPRTRKALEQTGVKPGPRIKIIEPLSYFSMLGHLQKCCFVITDSGGLQKEAFFFSKKCITLRTETEWTELVQLGANRVVPPGRGLEGTRISEAYSWAMEPFQSDEKPYGTGEAGQRIVRHIVDEELNLRPDLHLP